MKQNNQKGFIANIIFIIVLAVGLIVGVYLVQHPQIFKSKAASAPIVDALEIKDSSGKIINCDSNVNPPTCPISDQDITIKIKDINAIIPAAQMPR